MPEQSQPEITMDQAAALIRSRPYVGLLVISAIVGLVVSVASWLFLEGTYQLQQFLFKDLPDDLGFSGGLPLWYLLVVLGLAGVITAFAIARLPGNGGHVPVHGLDGGKSAMPIDLPGVLLAAIGSIGFGLVLGPEAPLIALGSGLAIYTLRAARREMPDQVMTIVGAAGSFAAVSFIFDSPIIAAVILLEATGLGGARQRIVLLPGLLAAGIGSLVSTGMGSITGLDTSDYALGALTLPPFDVPQFGDFAYAIALAAIVAVAVQAAVWIGRRVEKFATPKPFTVLPVVGLAVAVLAFAFAGLTGESAVAVLLSGQDALPALISDAQGWATMTLILLVLFKGIAYGLSLGSFRGGPTFPALFLGGAIGLLAAELPGMSTTPGVAICIAAATAGMLRLPLSAVVLTTLLTAQSGPGVAPLIIVAVVVSMVVTHFVTRDKSESPALAQKERAPEEALS